MSKTYRQLYEMVDELLPYYQRNDGAAWWQLFERLDMKYNRGAMTVRQVTKYGDCLYIVDGVSEVQKAEL